MREYIVTNLKEAADILPYKYEDTDYGRFTKGLANTLLLKFYMMTRQWDEAEKIGRELTKSEYGYKLVNDYHSLFSLSGEKNSEVIFSCVAEAGVMEQKWFAHVLTSDYPVPAGMAVTAMGRIPKYHGLPTNHLILKIKDGKELSASIPVRKVYITVGLPTVTGGQLVYSFMAQSR